MAEMSIFKYQKKKMPLLNLFSKPVNYEPQELIAGVYQGFLGMVLFVPLREKFNRQIGHLGINMRPPLKYLLLDEK